MRWSTPNLNNAERKRGNPITYQTGIRRIYERIEMVDEQEFKRYTVSRVYTCSATVRKAKATVRGKVKIEKVYEADKWSDDLFTKVVFTAIDADAAKAFEKALNDLKWIEYTIKGLRVSVEDINRKKPSHKFFEIKEMVRNRDTGKVTEVTVRVASPGTAGAFARALRK